VVRLSHRRGWGDPTHDEELSTNARAPELVGKGGQGPSDAISIEKHYA
jgi:hypothetical protein